MAQIKAFAALRPRPDVAEQVAAPPYDVVDSQQARELAKDNPISFLHVSKSEIDLPPETDQYDPSVYQQAADNLQKLLNDGVLIQDERPCLYAYAQQMGQHRQQGLVVCCSVDDYDNNVIRKHEHTRADKELDRTRHVDVSNVNSGPVFLTYRAQAELDRLIEGAIAQAELLYDFTASDGVRHTMHRIHDRGHIDALVNEYSRVERLYVADGHHRAASAARVGRERRAKEGNAPGQREHEWFMAVLFPHDQLRIMPYNRVVRDLHGLSEEELLAKVREKFEVEPVKLRSYQPKHRHHIGMYVAPRWYDLTPKEGTFPEGHPTEGLDVSILQRNLLAPVLGIEDPRTDKRIHFIGGIHGAEKLEQLVDGGEYAVAFSMYPVSLDELMAIADADEVMPPKSTWFEPKLRSGLAVHKLS